MTNLDNPTGLVDATGYWDRFEFWFQREENMNIKAKLPSNSVPPKK